MATTITVSTSAELYSALANAKGGETIKLAEGDYGTLSLSAYSKFNVSFASNVTITSADPLHPASFSGLALSSVSNLTLDSVICDYTTKPGEVLYNAPFTVYGSTNVTIRNSTFDGDVARGLSAVDDGYATGIGLTISKSTGVSVEGNDFGSFYRGMTFSECTDLNVTGNDVHDIRSDGMNFIQVHDVVIEGNHIHDFLTAPASGDHADMIQFWTAGTTEPSTDIVIRGNVLDIGAGTWTQSILMGNELVSSGLAGPEMFYRNVLIEDNVITNAHSHGITVGHTAGLIIRQNTVLHADGSEVDGPDTGVEIPAISVTDQSTDVSITGNVTAAVNGWTNQPGWTVGRNVLVQDQNPGTAAYYGDMFVSSSLTGPDSQHAYLALPGGVIDSLGAGAQMTRDYLPEPGTVAARFQATQDLGGTIQTRYFDASLCMADTGALPAGATFTWSFGDGSTAKGMKVAHYFKEGGYYDVTLTVRLPDGTTDTVIGQVGVQDRDILSLGTDGAFRASEYDDTIVLPTGPLATTAGIQLGATGVTATVALTHVADIMAAQDFSIAFRLNADSLTSTGELFRLHATMVASVTAKGEVQFQAFNDANGVVTLTSTGLSITDLRSHAIEIRLHDGTLQMWLDGKVAAQSAFSGTLRDYSHYELNFGNPWGGKNFNGDLTAFDIKIGEAAATYTKTIVSLGLDGRFHTTAVTAAISATELSADTVDPVGLHLGDIGLAARVAGKNLTDLLNSKEFEISMTLDADAVDGIGGVFRLNGGMVARVMDTGQLAIRAFGVDGEKVNLRSTVNLFDDLQSHDIDIRLAGGKMQLWIDNMLSGEKDFASALLTAGSNNLDFGARDGTKNFDGHLTAFDITVVETSFDTSLAAAAVQSDWATASVVVL